MKKTIAILLVFVMCVSLTACFSKNVELNETVKKGIAQVTITDVTLGDTNYLKTNATSNDFLTPISKDDLDTGDRFVKSTNDDDGSVVITMVVENVGKRDLSFGPAYFKVNYDDGNKYVVELCYEKDENGSWTEVDGVKLEKVTSGAVEVKMVAWVPSVIINDTASLTLDFLGYSYTIR